MPHATTPTGSNAMDDPLAAALDLEDKRVDDAYVAGYNDGEQQALLEAREAGAAHAVLLAREAGFYIGAARALLTLAQPSGPLPLTQRTRTVLTSIATTEHSFPTTNIVPPEVAASTTSSSSIDDMPPSKTARLASDSIPPTTADSITDIVDPVTAMERLRNRFRSITAAVRHAEQEAGFTVDDNAFPLQFTNGTTREAVAQAPRLTF